MVLSPPPPEPLTPERKQFETFVARQFLANHGQQIAAANSVGSDGLKNVDEVYGTRICDRIRSLKDEAPDFQAQKDPIAYTKGVAGLNKPKKHTSGFKKFGMNLLKAVGGFIAACCAIPALPVAAIAYGITRLTGRTEKKMHVPAPTELGAKEVVAGIFFPLTVIAATVTLAIDKATQHNIESKAETVARRYDEDHTRPATPIPATPAGTDVDIEPSRVTRRVEVEPDGLDRRVEVEPDGPSSALSKAIEDLSYIESGRIDAESNVIIRSAPAHSGSIPATLESRASSVESILRESHPAINVGGGEVTPPMLHRREEGESETLREMVEPSPSIAARSTARASQSAPTSSTSRLR